MPLAERVGYVATAAAHLDPWTRLTIRDRLADLSYGHAPALRHLLTAAAAWLAAVSDCGEVVSVDHVPVFLMPAEPGSFARALAAAAAAIEDALEFGTDLP